MPMSPLDFPQVIKSSYDPNKEALNVSQIGGHLVPEIYDAIALTYVPSGNGAGEIQTATYSLVGTTVATLTLTYDGSNRLSTVTKS